MSEFNIIQRPDLILRLQSMLGLRQAHVVPSLSETVQPVVIFGDVRDTGGERQIVRPVWGFDSQAPGGALFSKIALSNPPNSRTIVSVLETRVSNPTAVAAQQFSLGVFRTSEFSTGVAAVFPPKFRHSRAIDPLTTGQANLPAATLTHGTTIGAAGTAYVIKSPDTREVGTTQLVVLLPDWILLVTNDVVNQGISASFAWTEEDLEQRG